MTKKEFVKRLSRKSPRKSEVEVNAMLDTMFKEITKGLFKKQRIELRGLGIFYVSSLKERVGVDPRNGNKFKIEKSCRPFFRPSKKLLRIEGKE